MGENVLNNVRAKFILSLALFLCFSFLLFPEQSSPTPPDQLLINISRAIWAEERNYLDLEEKECLKKVAEDVAFDDWLAKKAVTEGIQLSETDRKVIEERRLILEFIGVVQSLAKDISVTDEEVEQYSKDWTKLIPEKWEVSYIFIDTTSAKTEAEKDELKKRAEWIKSQLTVENFYEIALLWSDAPSSVEGGYLGAISLEGLGPTFTSHIKQTPVGKIGGPYPTKSGWNIFYVRSHIPKKERNLTKAELKHLTTQVKADELAKKTKESHQEWQSLIQKYKIKEDPLINDEIEAMKNYLLSKQYILNKVESLNPSKEQLKSFYKENKQSFIKPPKRKAREILVTSEDWTTDEGKETWMKRIAVRNTAREIRERILKGEDFGELAKKYSASETASKGGELGWIQEPSTHLIDNALTQLKINEVSPPLATSKGYLLLQLLEVCSGEIMTFNEAYEQCERMWKFRELKRIEKELSDLFLKH